MSDLIERLRHAHENSPQRIAGSHIFSDAADAIEALKAENERLRKELGWAKADIAMAASIMRSR